MLTPVARQPKTCIESASRIHAPQHRVCKKEGSTRRSAGWVDNERVCTARTGSLCQTGATDVHRARSQTLPMPGTKKACSTAHRSTSSWHRSYALLRTPMPCVCVALGPPPPRVVPAPQPLTVPLTHLVHEEGADVAPRHQPQLAALPVGVQLPYAAGGHIGVVTRRHNDGGVRAAGPEAKRCRHNVLTQWTSLLPHGRTGPPGVCETVGTAHDSAGIQVHPTCCRYVTVPA